MLPVLPMILMLPMLPLLLMLPLLTMLPMLPLPHTAAHCSFVKKNIQNTHNLWVAKQQSRHYLAPLPLHQACTSSCKSRINPRPTTL